MKIETRNWAADRSIVTLLGNAPVDQAVQLVTSTTTFQVTENKDGTLEVRHNDGGPITVTPLAANAVIVTTEDRRESSLVRTLRALQELPAGTKLYSPRTTEFWTWHGTDNVPLVATGTGGCYTFTNEFVAQQAPFQIMHTPND